MENVDIYDKKRERIGIVKERNSIEKGEYRISAHIWIVDNNKKLLIQKRALTEKRFPGLWSQTAGGVLAGEKSIDTVKRESKEELDIDINDNEITYIGSYTRKKDIVDIWLVEKNINISELKLQENEVIDTKLVAFDEFDKMIEDEQVVPSINPSYMLLKNYYNNYKE